jgi:hypothetical protein
VKIQKIEATPQGQIYHISLIGVHIRPGELSVLQHSPVSQQTLDASVTQQVPDPGTFPDATAGIEEWRNAHGGVFTITLAEIADLISGTVNNQQPTSVS